MKKMSDLFYFPLASNGDYLMDNQKNVAAKFECPEQAAHVANAVNYIDDLAEALAVMLDVSERLAVVAGFDLSLRPEYEKAKSALAAYRVEA